MSKKNIYITLFAILYVCVGLVSTIHAVSFFGLANAPILGTILAITFEIGQAAVLFNLLTSPKQRKKFMPWALMCILTAVQILGNIYSSYKYIVTNSPADLKYFKEPIFIWTDIPDNMATVIITYIVGAILPIVALCLTEMVTSYLYDDEDTKKDNKKVEPETIIVKEPEPQPEVKEEPVETNNEPEFTQEDIEREQDRLLDESIEETINEVADESLEDYLNEIENETQQEEQETQDEQESEQVVEEKPVEKIEEPTQKQISPEVEEIFNKKSHFINI